MRLGGAEDIHGLIWFPWTVVILQRTPLCTSGVFPQVSFLTFKLVFDDL